jgi:phenylpropionate dioxygenase-like ring-hydroxylating dioxygenase large terminal subunit
MSDEMTGVMKNVWYAAARSQTLKRRPLARTVLGQRVVLFRDGAGSCVALEDRCPHRNVALSLGRVERGRLRCAYHGWQFDAQGACVEVPCAAPDEPTPRRRVRRFATHEANGLVWIHLAEQAAPRHTEPVLDAGHATALVETRVGCPIEHVLANFVDCGHTGFVHAGLFRGAPRATVCAHIHDTPTGVRIDTDGEQDPQSLLSRVFVGRRAEIVHSDEFIAPHTIRVRYQVGRSEVVTTSFCTPEDAETTVVYTRITVRMPPISKLAVWVLRQMTRIVLAQDKRILESQASTLRHFGGARFTSTAADVPTVRVAQSLRRFARRGVVENRGSSESVKYRL